MYIYTFLVIITCGSNKIHYSAKFDSSLKSGKSEKVALATVDLHVKELLKGYNCVENSTKLLDIRFENVD